MNKNLKISAIVGFILYAIAAFFCISLLFVLFDFCGLETARFSALWRFGKLFTGVYGICSVLIPLFLLVAAFECFMRSWHVRNGVVLAGSVIPFFTLDAVEHICRMLIAENSGDVLAVFVGHDHKNSFVGKYKNIDLGFTQSSGFNVYGNRTKRGVRCFVLDENNPRQYKTYTRTYEELVGKKVSRPVFDFLTSKGV